ncbi:MAG: RNB domain-containing ribonuclease, partial [Acholeplasmataceae bacterium]
MQNLYLEFYQKQTRKIDKSLVGDIDLKNYNYVSFQDPFYVLKPDYLIGRLDHKKTFGFLRQELEDVYIDQSGLMDAMHDDIVIVKEGTSPKIVLIIERALKVLVATVKTSHKGTYFETDTFIDRKIEVEHTESLVYGHVVMLEVDRVETDAIYAHIKKVIGHINDPDIETLKIVSAYDWPQKFSDEVIQSLEDIKIDVDYEKQTRTDLTDQLIITIDGKDAKDLDDAISLEFKDGMYHLGVHIADVSYYVLENTLIDQEAYRRSTSSYLADRVIPMLPHKLSNDLCSLNPNEMKLTLSCLMVLDSEGNIKSSDIQKTFIKSYRRMNYDEVNDFLIRKKPLKDSKIEHMLTMMNDLSEKLKVIRKARGEIEFSSSELGFIVDRMGKVLDVYERKTDLAEELIESFMLIA